MSCREIESLLVDLQDGRLDGASELRLYAHLETCAACRERAATWGVLLPAMRALAPETPSAMALRRMGAGIERRMAAHKLEPAARRARWIWLSSAAAVAAALVLAVGWRARAPVRGVANTPAFARVTSRIGATLDAGSRLDDHAQVAVPEGGELSLALESGASLKLIGPATLRLGGDAAHVALHLEHGRLEATVEHRRPNETFSVALPDGRIEVRGTRFVIVANPGASWVRVDEGRVAAFDAAGPEVMVVSGETHVFQPRALAAQLPAAPTPQPAPRVERDQCNQPAIDCGELTNRARAAMREGRYRDTLALVDPALQPRGVCAKRKLTCRGEIGYLHAEALRLAGELGAAVTAYKSLDRKDAPPAMRQNALYAAAQLERRLGKMSDARADYEAALAASPTGALREETMLGALETAAGAGDDDVAVAAARRYLAAFPNGIGARQANELERAQQSKRGTAP